MFSSPVFYIWLAWLLALAAFAVIRLKIHRREEQQREERRQQREVERGQRSTGAVRRQVRRPASPPDYRDQLTLAPVLAHSASAGVAAGVIKPATEPEITPDPKIGFDPATST